MFFQIVIIFLYFTSDFDQVCDRLHDLKKACISDSLANNVAVPFQPFSKAVRPPGKSV